MSQYLTPKTLDEATGLLQEYSSAARLIAGGTDLLVQFKKGITPPQYIIDMKGIPGQDSIIFDAKHGLTIGAMTTIREIELSKVVEEHFSCLSQAASKLGTVQVRNRATIGGNLCNATPSAETAPALLTLKAEIVLVCAVGRRTLPLEDFFLYPRQTVCYPYEVLSEIRVPVLPQGSASIYLVRTLRKALDLAIVGVAAAVTVKNGIIAEGTIALGAVRLSLGRGTTEEHVRKAARALILAWKEVSATARS